MTTFTPCAPPSEPDIQRLLQDYRKSGLIPNEANVRREMLGERWMNDRYVVFVRGRGTGMVHLSIKRIDREPVHDWRDLQEIKNQFVGPDCEAVELYPAESRLVDSANQYHLWVVEDPAFRFPFGFTERLVINELPVGAAAKQRPRVACQ